MILKFEIFGRSQSSLKIINYYLTSKSKRAPRTCRMKSVPPHFEGEVGSENIVLRNSRNVIRVAVSSRISSRSLKTYINQPSQYPRFLYHPEPNPTSRSIQHLWIPSKKFETLYATTSILTRWYYSTQLILHACLCPTTVFRKLEDEKI